MEEGDRDGLGRGSFGGGTILDVGVGIKGSKRLVSVLNDYNILFVHVSLWC